MSDQSRRKLLKSIAAGSGAVVAGKSLPDSWTRPVVDSVMLPAHAETSEASDTDDTSIVIVSGGGGGTFTVTDNAIGDDILDIFASPAHAVGLTTSYCLELTITQSNSVVTGVTVNKLCEDYCDGSEPSDDLRDTLIAPLALENTEPGKWWGRNGPGNYQLHVTEVDPSSNILAKTLYRKLEGTIYKNSSCSCPCDISNVPSDVRLKTNIEALSFSREGHKLYKFQYISEDNGNTYVGVMAQDIISSNPDAVIQNESGFYMVRYDQLGLKMVTLDQWENEGPDSVELMH